MIETTMKCGMGVLLLATVPIEPSPELWLNWGLAGLVVSYTLWRDWTREKRMSEALDKHQAWVQQTLLCALDRNTRALERIASRPCAKEQ